MSAKVADPEAPSRTAKAGSEDAPKPASFADIASAFALLGWTAFGGPAAHIGLFAKRFVGAAAEGKWVSEGAFAELLSLGQCLPGPTSTQVSFAIGVTQQGVPGGLLSGMLFQYPGAIILTLLGLLARESLDARASKEVVGATAGLGAAGVALVASAALGLGKKLCTKRDTQLIALLSCVVVCYITRGWIFPLVLVIGGIVTYVYREPPPPVAEGDAAAEGVQHLGLSRPAGALLILVWAAALIGGAVARENVKYEDARELHWFDAFFRTGSLIWGGGQVVLPLLQYELVSYDTCCIGSPGCIARECVERRDVGNACGGEEECKFVATDTWVTEQQFFAGLGLAQAMPGPLFNFAGYLGAVIGGVPGACVCWLGLFGPGVMLIYGVLPFWGKFRNNEIYRRCLPGLNASAVGLVVASVFKMMFQARSISRFPDYSLGIGLLAFAAVEFVEMPTKTLTLIQAPLVVVAGGVLGLVGAAAGAH